LQVDTLRQVCVKNRHKSQIIHPEKANTTPTPAHAELWSASLLGKSAELVYLALLAAEELHVLEIAEQTGKSKRTVERALKRLVHHGFVLKSTRGVYSVTSAIQDINAHLDVETLAERRRNAHKAHREQWQSAHRYHTEKYGLSCDGGCVPENLQAIAPPDHELIPCDSEYPYQDEILIPAHEVPLFAHLAPPAPPDHELIRAGYEHMSAEYARRSMHALNMHEHLHREAHER
jgi:DNA-binding transcriptional ArsR family regulator